MANPGDYVEITTTEDTLKGTLLPRPNLLSKSITILKLDSGYNIGIENRKIKTTKILKEYKAIEQKKQDIAHNKDLPTVAIISFGGTISSKVDYRTGGVFADYDAHDFIAMCPELKNIANLNAEKAASLMSEDMSPKDWKFMSETILPKLQDPNIKGIVITQGTDTLHYSTAALSFMIQDINKPIIFTASQRSIDRGSSDAFMNLICAVQAAATFDGALVATCMHATSDDEYCALIRGTKVRKMHTSRRDAFQAVNDEPLAYIYPNGNITYHQQDYPKRHTRTPKLKNNFEQKTGLLQIHPGINPKLIDFFIDNDYEGLVISATALGHVPTLSSSTLIPRIKKAIKQGMLVVIASQTLYGAVHPYVYANLRKLSMECNAVFAHDMIPEVAYVKLGWAIAQSENLEQAAQLFQKNIAGELQNRLHLQ